MPDATRRSTSADLRAVRERCAARLHTLPVPVPFDLHAFCAALAAQRRRPLRLEPFPPTASARGSTGVWFAEATADIIFYEQQTSLLHQEHIILHELSHMLCGHPPRVEAAASLQATVLPHIRLDLIEGALHRAAYSTAEEREAEIFASLLLERAVHPAARTSVTGTRAGNLNARLETTLAARAGEQ